MAGARGLGATQQASSSAAAERAGFELASPMALAITNQRLLSLSMGAQAGMGIGGGVKELVGSAPLADVEGLSAKRLLVGKVVEVTVHGQSFKLEVGAGANVKGVTDAFDRMKGK
jgi:hypothetical protein